MKNNIIKVLLVEDERMLAEILADTLSDHNFEIKQAYNGVMALDGWRDFQPDVIVTDIMMPQMDGYTLVKNLRKEGCSAPILYLTARSSTEDVVKGFETGGNDFLRKPFAIDELIVRIRALAGRLKPTTAEKEYKIGRYDFLADAGILVLDGEQQQLSAREAEVLKYLCNNIGQTIESSQILMQIWGDDSFFNLRSLNVFISRLRKRLIDDKSVEIISIRGVGYRLKA
ncbi:MAG: response regulator transcription factor [Alistipes sp.]|nr:response regulator transcription factor [Alistipes sp.]